MAKKIGTVIETGNRKSLVQYKGNYYVIKGTHLKDEEVEFDTSDSMPMPSLMFALATLQEENIDDTLKFIKQNWFGGMNN